MIFYFSQKEHMKFKSGLLIIGCLTFLNTYPSEPIACKDLYLDLMKKCLINSIYQDPNNTGNKYNKEQRENGLDWPNQAHTMIGLKRLNNIQFCVESVLKNNILGDLVETGVWRGGAVIFMRAILKAHNITDRMVWAADSFKGLPAPDTSSYPMDQGSNFHTLPYLAVSLNQVKSNFSCYDLLDNQVGFLSGWFKDTLPSAPINKIAVLRLDGDLYESTMEALTNLYPKVSIGGYIIIDDYCISCCRRAVEDFRNKNNIQDPIITIDSAGVFWQRSK